MNSANQKVNIQINEPWEFLHPNGSISFKGVIQGFCVLQEKNHMLIKVTEPFPWKDKTVQQLLVTPRCVEKDFSVLDDNEALTVGITRVLSEDEFQPNESVHHQQVDYFAIGCISLSKT